ncbi:MAG TPA: tetratricopeptide repeat protein, partial [Povalibacter sp.]|nr:tetratricopeptide repeat protein [Povalibacter sp.]
MSTPDVILTEAMAAHQAGRLQQAAGQYEQVLQQQPDNPDALHFYGLLHFQLGRGIEAVKLIGRSLDLAPGNPHAWNNLGNILVHLSRLDDALDAYDRCAWWDPTYAGAPYGKSDVLRRLGRA